MPTKVEAYKCDFCHRCFMRLVNANSHEKACNNNPERRHCKTCVHGVLGVIAQHNDIFDRAVVDDYGPLCNYHKIPMSRKPYYIECGTYDNDYGPDEPMPGTCLAYEYKGKVGWTKQKAPGETDAQDKVQG